MMFAGVFAFSAYGFWRVGLGRGEKRWVARAKGRTQLTGVQGARPGGRMVEDLPHPDTIGRTGPGRAQTRSRGAGERSADHEGCARLGCELINLCQNSELMWSGHQGRVPHEEIHTRNHCGAVTCITCHDTILYLLTSNGWIHWAGFRESINPTAPKHLKGTKEPAKVQSAIGRRET